jgi:methionyl-tRNA formyltransferase
MKIIFFGSTDFSLPALTELSEHFEVAAVVTETDKLAGRGNKLTISPIKMFALDRHIEFFQPDKVKNNTKFLEEIKTIDPDLIVVSAYGKILPKELLEIPKLGCLNIHPSLLPKYRGASPIQTALLNGDTETAVSFMLMDEGMDSGAILMQKKQAIAPTDDYNTLSEKFSQLSADLIADVITSYSAGKTAPKAQNEADATFCKMIAKEDGKIDWTKPANEVANQIRAFIRWPGSFTTFNGKKLDILKASAVETNETAVPGTVIKQNNEIAVICGKGALVLKQLKLEGKKECDAKAFVNGYKDFVGKILL